MPTCRFCLGTFSRDQFIHGNGPRAQVCIRCAVDRKMATEEEIENLYNEKLRNARLSLVARRYSMFLYIPVCLLYTSPSPRDRTRSRMPSSA